MKKERRKLKSIVITGALQGLVFASVMALFDYYSNKEFSIFQFIIYFIFFGGIMAFVFRNKYTKE